MDIGIVTKKAAYVAIGTDLEGKKDVLGIWLGANESAKYWLNVLTGLKNRGVKDILIASVDGLSGFVEAIHTAFPQTEVQRCIIHQIRAPTRYVSYKDVKAFSADLKPIYKAATEEAALAALDDLEAKWGAKYALGVKSWRVNCPELSTMFEKQYQYRAEKKIEYFTPSEAEINGYERISKYPKSTKFGRQNPISERWNSDDQLLVWREAWADIANKYLALYPWVDERIDHRSHAARGIDEQPTIHEGVIARALEQSGVISDRCELNRQIKADNKLLRELKAQVAKLLDVVKNTIPAIAEALETIRQNMLIFRYQLLHTRASKRKITDTLNAVLPDFRKYTEIVKQLRDKTKERREPLAESHTHFSCCEAHGAFPPNRRADGGYGGTAQ